MSIRVQPWLPPTSAGQSVRWRMPVAFAEGTLILMVLSREPGNIVF